MTDAEFYKSFHFNVFLRRHSYSTDWMKDAGAPEHYFARLIKGTAKIVTARETLHIQSGDIFYIPHHLRYRSYWYPNEEGEILLLSLGFQYFPSEAHVSYKLQTIDCNATEKAMLAELENDPTLSPLSIGRLYRFLGEVTPKMQLHSEKSGNTTISKALEFMRQNTAYSIKDVAAFCGVSESGLYAKFKKQLNETPVMVRNRFLVEKAVELLSSTDLTIEEISGQLGFCSSAYFRKVFRAQMGNTPNALRKQTKSI